MMHYVIIGMGVAGFTAVESIRRRDPHGEIHLVSEEPEGYYSRPGLAYYLSDEITEKLLFPFTHKDIHTLGVTQHVARALCILPEIRRVELSGPVRLSYDRLLIATGAEARPLDIPGSEAEGVVKLDCLGDARAILRQARRTKQAVVVGGGITALELVEGLRARRVKVHYLLRGERYWNNVLDPIEARIIEKRLKEEGVQIHYHSELGEVIQKNGRVVGVRAAGASGVHPKDIHIRATKAVILCTGGFDMAFALARVYSTTELQGLLLQLRITLQDGLRFIVILHPVQFPRIVFHAHTYSLLKQMHFQEPHFHLCFERRLVLRLDAHSTFRNTSGPE